MVCRSVRLTSALVSIPLALSYQTLAADDTHAVQQYSVDNMTQPIKLDCVEKHGKYLPSISAQEISDGQQVAMQMDGHSMHDHSHHQQMMNNKSYSTSVNQYPIPDVLLSSDAGEKKRIAEVLNSDKPVMLNFIFTTCTTICPVLSASFTQVQKELQGEVEDIMMVSISIDPEYDTVDRLSAYAKRFEAGPQWEFFTGKLKDVIAVEKAFDIYRGSKMNHEPVTLIRAKSDQPWLRIEGLANANDIVSEYRELVANAK